MRPLPDEHDDREACNHADGIVKLLGMMLSPGSRKHFPDVMSANPTLRQPALSP
jgi:hypothetical protein